MDIFDALTMIGGLSLFLFGMNIMGQAREEVSACFWASLPLAGLPDFLPACASRL